MKVHLIKKQTILDYISKNAQSKSAFLSYLYILKQANWNSPIDIIATFGSADILGNSSERVVFNIGGNKYRIICSYLFGETNIHLFVNWIGTHAEYTKLCNKAEQYTVNSY